MLSEDTPHFVILGYLCIVFHHDNIDGFSPPCIIIFIIVMMRFFALFSQGYGHNDPRL